MEYISVQTYDLRKYGRICVMKNHEFYAVVTGDIVGSSKLKASQRSNSGNIA